MVDACHIHHVFARHTCLGNTEIHNFLNKTKLKGSAMTDRNDSEHEKDKWLYVAIENPGGDEKILGLHDSNSDMSYIPAFESKEDALTCLVNMPRRENHKYEVQAFHLDFLRQDARNNGFLIFLTDGQGKILRQIET